MLWVPTTRPETLPDDALPAPLRVTGLPSATAPSKNCTVPVGTGPLPPTVTLNVNAWPNTDGLALEVGAAMLPDTCKTVRTTSWPVPPVYVMANDAPPAKNGFGFVNVPRIGSVPSLARTVKL